MSRESDASASSSNIVAFGLGAVLALHLIVLVTTKAPLGQSLASQGLQTLSVVLACFFAGYASIKSRDFARAFWAFSSAGFALLVLALVTRHFEHGEGFGTSDFLFLLHMVPFGMVLLLGERSRTRGTPNWPMILDFMQILIIVVILFIAFIYIPSKSAPVEYIRSLYAAFAVVLIARNVSITSGFWFRTLLANSERERLAFRWMGTYLLIYTLGSALTHYVFLRARPAPVWIELQGSIPFLLAAWMFSVARFASERKRRDPEVSRGVVTPPHPCGSAACSRSFRKLDCTVGTAPGAAGSNRFAGSFRPSSAGDNSIRSKSE